MSIVDWFSFPDDGVEAIQNVLFEPLKRDSPHVYTMGLCSTEKATLNEECIHAYFALRLVNKQFSRVGKTFDFDWIKFLRTYGIGDVDYRFLGRIVSQGKREEEKLCLINRGIPHITEGAKKMLKTLAYYDCALPVLRHNAHSLMEKKGIVCLQYRIGYIGDRNLKAMKFFPNAFSTPFKKIVSSYQKLKKKRLSLMKALEKYARKLPHDQ